jgi:plastocyanin domain-containing protein
MRTSSMIACCLALAACAKKGEVPSSPTPTVQKASAEPRRILLEVTDDGFVPDAIKLRANEAVTLVITRKTDETCATDLLIDGTDINVPLPLNKAVEVAWTPSKAGSVKFGCAMDMMVSGVLLVE